MTIFPTVNVPDANFLKTQHPSKPRRDGLKIKIFHGHTASEVEKTVNDWFSANSGVKPKLRAQTQCKDAGDHRVMVSFFYSEPPQYAVSLNLNQIVQSGQIQEVPEGAIIIIEE